MSLGYQRDSVWVRIAVVNEQPVPASYILEVAWPLIPSLDFYLVLDEVVLHQASGQLVNETQQPLVHRNELFPFQLSPGQAATVYMKVVSDGTVLLPVYLWSASAFFEYDSSINLLLGLFFGAMAVMAFYNLSLAMLTRDTAYLSYVCYVLALTAFQANVTGVGGLYVWPDWLDFKLISYGITSGLGFTAATLFTIQFLELRKSNVWFFFALAWLSALLDLDHPGGAFPAKIHARRSRLSHGAGFMRYRMASSGISCIHRQALCLIFCLCLEFSYCWCRLVYSIDGWSCSPNSRDRICSGDRIPPRSRLAIFCIGGTHQQK